MWGVVAHNLLDRGHFRPFFKSWRSLSPGAAVTANPYSFDRVSLFIYLFIIYLFIYLFIQFKIYHSMLLPTSTHTHDLPIVSSYGMTYWLYRRLWWWWLIMRTGWWNVAKGHMVFQFSVSSLIMSPVTVSLAAYHRSTVTYAESKPINKHINTKFNSPGYPSKISSLANLHHITNTRATL